MNLRDLDDKTGQPVKSQLSNRQLGQYKRWASIVLDASVLLNLYAYTETTQRKFLSLLERLRDRIYLPYQSASEYRRNRARVIEKHISFSSTIRGELASLRKGFPRHEALKGHPKVGSKLQHPFVSIDGIESRLDAVIAECRDMLETAENRYRAYMDEDPVEEHLAKITADRIREPLEPSVLDALYMEGLRRYDLRQPPGYSDAEGSHAKKGIAKYGDLVLWQEMLNLAKETGRAVHFVTDDMKEDWWKKENGTAVGPRAELVEEMSAKTSRGFIMSTSERFFSWGAKQVATRLSKSAIREAQRVSSPTAPEWLAGMNEVYALMRSIRQAEATALGSAVGDSAELIQTYLRHVGESFAEAQRMLGSISMPWLKWILPGPLGDQETKEGDDDNPDEGER